MEFIRVNNDKNGNPRYVCHFYNLLTDAQKNDRTGFDFVEKQYAQALHNAKRIGGEKFHNKQYGGGIVFQSFDIKELKDSILNLLKKC